MSTQASIRQFLDRGSLRWLLAPLATADVVRERREPCLVLPSAGWVHYYRSGSIEWNSIGAPTPALLEQEAIDVFLYRYIPRPGDTVLDVGAGVGEEVRTLSRLVGQTGRVIAVEAHPGAVDLLRRNVRRWKLDNVQVVAAALAGSSGTLRLTDDGASIGNHIAVEGGVEVRAMTLDELLVEMAVEHVDFLKMNIEGAERPALSETSRLSNIANAAISCHDFLSEYGADPELVATSADVADILRESGFDLVQRLEDARPWVRFYLYATKVDS